ncbi:MAG TPA: RdgB/HAM1 family non-canonical purine NTP pyrophosphatase [Pyrinomonadaceae bacterium]|nr:RdgB/HAM1 family non-canonical purine NTP pyrophosphatase [Pyrinomonadaceae bacterium]
MNPEQRVEILVATSNPGKLLEIQEALRGLPVNLASLQDFSDISSVDEVGETYEENAVLKALSYATQSGVWALADDSGLEVDALDGKPGVRSARYGGSSDRERIAKLLVELAQRPEQARTARFVCCMVLAGWPIGVQRDNRVPQVLHVSQANCEGGIISELRGNNGFGYDPVFVPVGHDQTLAELPLEVKNLISHRAKALIAMREFLNRWIAPT